MKSVALYFFLNLARAIMMLILYIPLTLSGYSMDLKKCVIIVWGGLRGALGLALALIVENTHNS